METLLNNSGGTFVRAGQKTELWSSLYPAHTNKPCFSFFCNNRETPDYNQSELNVRVDVINVY